VHVRGVRLDAVRVGGLDLPPQDVVAFGGRLPVCGGPVVAVVVDVDGLGEVAPCLFVALLPLVALGAAGLPLLLLGGPLLGLFDRSPDLPELPHQVHLQGAQSRQIGG